MKTLLMLVVLAGSADATKPCSEDTWFAKQDRTSAEWAQMADWVVVAKVTRRKEIIEPYVNCYMKDRSKCTMEDNSIVTVKVLRWEKGSKFKLKKLEKGYCAPFPPKTVGEIYRFYGKTTDSYIFYEKAAP